MTNIRNFAQERVATTDICGISSRPGRGLDDRQTRCYNVASLVFQTSLVRADIVRFSFDEQQSDAKVLDAFDSWFGVCGRFSIGLYSLFGGGKG
jgi:hypothetical protein